MGDDKKNIIKLSDFYKDLNIPETCFNKESVRNLLQLSADNNLNLFNNKNRKIKTKSKKKIVKECEQLKKIKIAELSKELNKFKKDQSINSEKILETNNKFLNNLESIDSIINIVNTENEIDELNNLLSDSDEFIEMFSN
tara:strand:- start:38 stop:457 length:420 start_codon:yes stop_codon:yes gene_type:complete